MKKIEYQNLGVKPDTHYRVKFLAAERGLSIDAMVGRLLDEFERTQKYARMKRLTEEPVENKPAVFGGAADHPYGCLCTACEGAGTP